MNRTTDSKKSNTYEIENAFWTALGENKIDVASIADAQELVDVLCSEFGVEAVTVVQGDKGNASFWRVWGRTISILPRMMKRWIVVHEFAHALNDHRMDLLKGEVGIALPAGLTAGHGPAFLNAYVDVVRFVYGDATADAFSQTWKANKRTPMTVAQEVLQNVAKNDKALVSKIRNWLIKLPSSTYAYKRQVAFHSVTNATIKDDMGIFLQRAKLRGEVTDAISIVQELEDGQTMEPVTVASLLFDVHEMVATDFTAKGNIISFSLDCSEYGVPYSSFHHDDVWYTGNRYLENQQEAVKVHVTINLDLICDVHFEAETDRGNRYEYESTVAQESTSVSEAINRLKAIS